MRILKYLSRDIFAHTFAVAFVLFLVVFSGRFIRYLAEAAVGDLTSDVLFPVMFYKLPSFFELILPLAMFVGILLSLGRLYADSELVVLRACGLSQGRLALYVLVPASVIMVLVAALAMLLAPDGSARAQALLEDPESTGSLQIMAEGRFKKQRQGDLVTYAERVGSDGILSNIFLAERQRTGDSSGLVVTYAREGEIVYDEDSGRRYLELRDGTRFQGLPGEFDFDAIRFARYGELIAEREGGIRQRLRIEAVPTAELVGSDDDAYRAAFLWRVSLPIFVPVVAVIALALSRTDSRRGRYARLGPALAIFLTYFLSLNQVRTQIETGAGAWTMIAVHCVFAWVAAGLLYREQLPQLMRRWRG